MKENTKIFGIDGFWFVFGVIVLLILIATIAITNSPKEIDMGQYIKGQYINGEISTFDYMEYQNFQIQNTSKMLFSFAAFLAGLGIVFHGIKLVHVEKGD